MTREAAQYIDVLLGATGVGVLYAKEVRGELEMGRHPFRQVHAELRRDIVLAVHWVAYSRSPDVDVTTESVKLEQKFCAVNRARARRQLSQLQ